MGVNCDKKSNQALKHGNVTNLDKLSNEQFLSFSTVQ